MYLQLYVILFQCIILVLSFRSIKEKDLFFTLGHNQNKANSTSSDKPWLLQIFLFFSLVMRTKLRIETITLSNAIKLCNLRHNFSHYAFPFIMLHSDVPEFFLNFESFCCNKKLLIYQKI